MSHNKLKLLLIVGVIYALIIIINLIIGLIRAENFSEYNDTGILASAYKLSEEDSGLIAKKWWSKLRVEEVYLSKNRGPVSQLITNDNKHRLLIYKIGVKANFAFKDSINVQSVSSGETIGVEYRIIGRSFFFLLYKGGLITPVSKIYLTLGGDSILNVIKNDTVLSCNLLCHNLTTRYTEKDVVDLAFLPEEYSDQSEPDNTHLDVLLFKRNDAVYLLFMAPTNPNEGIDPKLLYETVTENN